MNQNKTVFIVDDNAAFLESVSALVSSMGWKTQCFNCAEEYLGVFNAQSPGCLIADVRMPGLSGLDLQERLRQEPPSPSVIVLTGHPEIAVAPRAIRQGAVQFLQKPFTDSELWDAIQRAFVQDTADRQAHAVYTAKRASFDQLTQGEKDVLQLILAGHANKFIAVKLKVSLRTVEDRRARLMHKLAVESVVDLVCLSFKLKIPHRI